MNNQSRRPRVRTARTVCELCGNRGHVSNHCFKYSMYGSGADFGFKSPYPQPFPPSACTYQVPQRNMADILPAIIFIMTSLASTTPDNSHDKFRLSADSFWESFSHRLLKENKKREKRAEDKGFGYGFRAGYQKCGYDFQRREVKGKEQQANTTKEARKQGMYRPHAPTQKD